MGGGLTSLGFDFGPPTRDFSQGQIPSLSLVVEGALPSRAPMIYDASRARQRVERLHRAKLDTDYVRVKLEHALRGAMSIGHIGDKARLSSSITKMVQHYLHKIVDFVGTMPYMSTVDLAMWRWLQRAWFGKVISPLCTRRLAVGILIIGKAAEEIVFRCAHKKKRLENTYGHAMCQDLSSSLADSVPSGLRKLVTKAVELNPLLAESAETTIEDRGTAERMCFHELQKVPMLSFVRTWRNRVKRCKVKYLADQLHVQVNVNSALSKPLLRKNTSPKCVHDDHEPRDALQCRRRRWADIVEDEVCFCYL